MAGELEAEKDESEDSEVEEKDQQEEEPCVVLAVPDGPVMVVLVMACAFAGVCFVPVELSRTPPRRARFVAGDCRAAAVIAWRRELPSWASRVHAGKNEGRGGRGGGVATSSSSSSSCCVGIAAEDLVDRHFFLVVDGEDNAPSSESATPTAAP